MEVLIRIICTLVGFWTSHFRGKANHFSIKTNADGAQGIEKNVTDYDYPGHEEYSSASGDSKNCPIGFLFLLSHDVHFIF